MKCLKVFGSFVLIAAATQAQLAPPSTSFFSQDSPGIGVAVEEGARFGEALAAGDFNCDGFTDLAVGMPGEDLVGATNGGRLIVLHGSVDGITTLDNAVWGQNSPVIMGDADNGDRFSEVMAVGDFNNDECDDLAVGVPWDDVGSESAAGAVNVIFGDEDDGLNGDGDQLLHQNVGDIQGVAENGDRFGTALAVGDFNNDGVDDLAIGVTGEALDGNSVENAGLVHVVYGSIFGLLTTGTDTFFRGQGLSGTPQDGERLGAALAAGNLGLLNGDELVIGAPGRTVNGETQAGAVLLVSDVSGLVFDSEWSQDTPGIFGLAESNDRFGSRLAVGDFDGVGIDELAVGVFEEDSGLIGSTGLVHILNFVTEAHQSFAQDDFGPEMLEIGDEFGHALSVGDFNNDGADDLAIGVPGETLGPKTRAGMIHILHGVKGSGLSAEGFQTWLQTINPSEDEDAFGFVLAAGKFSGEGGDDLAIGAPGETIAGLFEAGGVNLLYSASSTSLFADGFESGDTSAWSEP